MGVPEDRGGDGAGLVELAIVAEEVGRHAAPVPVVETMVAARLLGASTDDPAARSALERVVAGEVATLAVARTAPGRQLVPAGRGRTDRRRVARRRARAAGPTASCSAGGEPGERAARVVATSRTASRCCRAAPARAALLGRGRRVADPHRGRARRSRRRRAAPRGAVRQGPPHVRRADRLLPGDRPSPGRRRDGHRGRTPARAPGGMVRRPRAGVRSAEGRRARSCTPRSRRSAPPPWRSTPRVGSGSPWSPTCSCTSVAPRAGRWSMGDRRTELRRIGEHLVGVGAGSERSTRRELRARSPLDADTLEFWHEVRAFFDEHVTEEVHELERRTGGGFDEELHLAMGERGWVAPSWPTGRRRCRPRCGARRDREPGAPALRRPRRSSPARPSSPRCSIRSHGRRAAQARGASRHRERHHPGLPGLHRARRRLRPRRGADAGRCATATSGSSRARRCSRPARSSASTASCSPGRTRTSPSTRGSPCSSCPSTSRESRSAGSGPSAASARTSSTTTRSGCPTTSDSGRSTGAGRWSRSRSPRSTASDGDRELALESPGHVQRDDAETARARSSSSCATRSTTRAGRGSRTPSVLERLGRVALDIEASDVTPGPMGRIISAETLVRDASDLLELVGPAGALAHGADGAACDGYAGVRVPVRAGHADLRRLDRHPPQPRRRARCSVCRAAHPAVDEVGPQWAGQPMDTAVRTSLTRYAEGDDHGRESAQRQLPVLPPSGHQPPGGHRCIRALGLPHVCLRLHEDARRRDRAVDDSSDPDGCPARSLAGASVDDEVGRGRQPAHAARP